MKHSAVWDALPLALFFASLIFVLVKGMADAARHVDGPSVEQLLDDVPGLEAGHGQAAQTPAQTH